jgi:hypothetical protein
MFHVKHRVEKRPPQDPAGFGKAPGNYRHDPRPSAKMFHVKHRAREQVDQAKSMDKKITTNSGKTRAAKQMFAGFVVTLK